MTLSLVSQVPLGTVMRGRLGALIGPSLARPRSPFQRPRPYAPWPFVSGRPAFVDVVPTTRRRWSCVTVRSSSGWSAASAEGRGGIAKGAKGAKGAKQRYMCSECGEDYPQWHGQCPACKAWDSFTLFTIEPAPGRSAGGKGGSGGGAGARALARATADASLAAPVASTSNSSTPAQTRLGLGSRASRGGWVADEAMPRRLADVLSADAAGERMPRVSLPRELGAEVERVLGGGVVPGAMTLIGGDPGVGKSTLALQVAGLLGEQARKSHKSKQKSSSQSDEGNNADIRADGASEHPAVLYASGEESVEQLACRAERLGVDPSGVLVFSATRLEAILAAVVREQPAALVVDSIQTVFLEDATGSPGSVSQVRECATALLHAAKTTGMPVFIIGHVTKSGDIAGPRVLEHIVDVVLYLEGDADRAVRVLRGHKNRYGSTDEVGVFEMVDCGLSPVASPSALFMGERILTTDVSSAPTVTVQGSRPFMLEVQALCSESVTPYEGGGVGSQAIPAVRTAVGFRPERMQLLLAVLAKFVLGRQLYRSDVFVNIAGGLKLEDPSTDVAVALAIASSHVERTLPPDMAFFGEVGLGGELRPVAQSERRLMEAATMGFKRVLMPRAGAVPDIGKKQGVKVLLCNTLSEAVTAALGVEPPKRGGQRKKM